MTQAFREGVLRVDKPVGPTSHDVVSMARRALGVRRIGHTGTLDPFASGLLLLCVGPATRVAEYLTGMDKVYEATALLGVATDTEDREGEVISRSDGWRQVTRTSLEAALTDLTGELLQVPSRFSAKKVGGVAAHRLARRGQDVDLPPNRITVYSLDVVAFDAPEVRLRVHCSSGTYVRSLARDLGAALGVGAHLTALRRTAVGRFTVSGAVDLEGLAHPDRVAAASLTAREALSDLPRVELDAAGARAVGHGRTVATPLPEGGPVTACQGDVLVAIGAVEGGLFRPRKVLAHA